MSNSAQQTAIRRESFWAVLIALLTVSLAADGNYWGAGASGFICLMIIGEIIWMRVKP